MPRLIIFVSVGLMLSFTAFGEGKAKKERPTKEEMMQKKMKMLDKDGDGKISINEYLEKLTLEFNRKDTDGDGFLDSTEFATKPKKEKKPKKGSEEQTF